MSKQPDGTRSIQLAKEDCALIFRGNGKCETVISLIDKNEMTDAEQTLIGLAGLLQDPSFVQSVIEHFHLNIQKAYNNKTIA
jgi:hypothetical protein